MVAWAGKRNYEWFSQLCFDQSNKLYCFIQQQSFLHTLCCTCYRLLFHLLSIRNYHIDIHHFTYLDYKLLNGFTTFQIRYQIFNSTYSSQPFKLRGKYSNREIHANMSFLKAKIFTKTNIFSSNNIFSRNNIIYYYFSRTNIGQPPAMPTWRNRKRKKL